jgi:hypothetical protein
MSGTNIKSWINAWSLRGVHICPSYYYYHKLRLLKGTDPNGKGLLRILIIMLRVEE